MTRGDTRVKDLNILQPVPVTRAAITHLDQGVENLKDLFLDQDRLLGGVRKQTDETLLQHGQEVLHSGYERAPLLWFLIPGRKQKVTRQWRKLMNWEETMTKDICVYTI